MKTNLKIVKLDKPGPYDLFCLSIDEISLAPERAGQMLSETSVPRWFWPLKICTAPRGGGVPFHPWNNNNQFHSLGHAYYELKFSVHASSTQSIDVPSWNDHRLWWISLRPITVWKPHLGLKMLTFSRIVL